MTMQALLFSRLPLVSLVPLPVLMAGSMALLVAIALVLSQNWHGHYTMDSASGIQKCHTQPTPRVGGIAIALGIAAGYLSADASKRALLGPLVLAGIPALAFGLLEDFTKCVSVRARLLATMGGGVLGWLLTGYSVTYVNVWGLDWLLGFTAISVAFTAFAIGGISNSINIIDGFNGLSGGTALIILAAFGALFGAFGDTDMVHVSMILAAAIMGFLLVNWPLGKLFLGDGGAYFVGFALAWLSVLVLKRHPEISAWAPLLICGFPMFEVLFSIVRRHRRQISVSGPDRLHLHSLVKRRLVRRIFPNASPLLGNSTTGALMWSASLLPATMAVQWRHNTPLLMLGSALCVLLYLAIYTRLTQFRWCFSPATLVPKTA